MNRPIRIPSRYMMPNRMQPQRNCKALLLQLQTVDFAITDTLLYLDAYPNDNRAMEYLNNRMAEREQILAAMKESGCPPVTPAAEGSESFRWVENPWPWENDAN